MFYSFNLKEFGKELARIRHSNNLSQKKVHMKTGINVDTLRRIENGLVLPKQETLLILSYFYKRDLLKVFLEYRYNKQLLDIYSNLDSILTSTSTSSIIEFCEDALYYLNNSLAKIELLIPIEKQQLIYLLKAIKYSLEPNTINISTEYLLKALNLTIPDIFTNKLNDRNFTELELRLIYLIAANLLDIKEYDKSINLLTDLISNEKYNLPLKINIKIYALMSYNFFLKDLYEESLLYADKGLELTREVHTTYNLHFLLSRKAVALKKLGCEEKFIENMQMCIAILKYEKNIELILHYKKVCKEKYDIELI